ncbi:hypothetical protein BJV77DRAFT_1074369 [Russula vinacea]|nr:hypothetical protein BJV77DRAFT_1074369 [Russula vinacea]
MTTTSTTTSTTAQQKANVPSPTICSSRAASKAPLQPHAYPHTFPSPSIATLLECLPTPETSTILSSSSVISKQWSTSSTEERKRIKEFWLGLGEQDRRKHLRPRPPRPPLPLQGVR